MFADHRRTVVGAIGDEVPKEMPVLCRADTGFETQGVTGGRSAPLPVRECSTSRRLAHIPQPPPNGGSARPGSLWAATSSSARQVLDHGMDTRHDEGLLWPGAAE